MLNKIETVVHSMWPKVIVMPIMMPGATDSLFTRQAGIPSYGLSGTWNDIHDIRWHGKNERHQVDDFYSGIAFTYRLMKHLS